MGRKRRTLLDIVGRLIKSSLVYSSRFGLQELLVSSHAARSDVQFSHTEFASHVPETVAL